MKFDLYEQRGSETAPAVRKRVLKAQYKSVKFQANSFLNDNRAKNQGNDYYVGVYDSKNDKCYLVPVSSTY